MTALMPTARTRTAARESSDWRSESTVAVEVLICGARGRGDDGAPLMATHLIDELLPDGVRQREVGQLSVDDLLAVPERAGLVIVDTAIGLDPGWIVRLPLHALVGRDTGFHTRSAQALAIPEVVGLVEMIRGRPLHGVIVVIGGVDFGVGDAPSWPVAAALEALGGAILAAVEVVREECAATPPLA